MVLSDSSSSPLSLLFSVSICSSPACVGGKAPEHNPSSSSSCVDPRPLVWLEPLSAVPKTPEHKPISSPMLASIAFSSRLSRINCLLWERGAPGRGPTLRKPSASSNWEWVSSSREKRPWESPPRPGPEAAPPRGPESAPGDGGAYKSWESSTGRQREGSESFPELWRENRLKIKPVHFEANNSNKGWNIFFLSHLGGRAEKAGPEEAGRWGAENWGIGDVSPCGALMTDRLVGGYHRSSKFEAAVVAVIFHQGQRVVLF